MAALAHQLAALLGHPPNVTIRCFDGSGAGPDDAAATLVVHSSDALRRMLYAPGELGFGRGYVAGDIDIEGDVFAALAVRDGRPDLRVRWRDLVPLLGAAGGLRPVAPPPEEARLRGRRHSKARDAAAIAHHYDVSNEFYRLVLGPSMTYSCAVWRTPSVGLETAQAAKYELVCRKLGLRAGMRLLDVGCGWGGMVRHAARHHGVSSVGVTISARQADWARKVVADDGLTDLVEIRQQDYRDIEDGPYDAISSIGMFEHVGLRRTSEYLDRLRSLLRSGGRLLNHAIASPAPDHSRFGRRSFVDRYVFPDGELLEVGRVVTAMHDLGLEVRHVEDLREHYALTLRAWVANLERSWDEAVTLVGLPRAKIWRLYMAGSALRFEAGDIQVDQVLAVRPDSGRSGMPLRPDWDRRSTASVG